MARGRAKKGGAATAAQKQASMTQFTAFNNAANNTTAQRENGSNDKPEDMEETVEVIATMDTDNDPPSTPYGKSNYTALRTTPREDTQPM